jgi:hypothetical protein
MVLASCATVCGPLHAQQPAASGDFTYHTQSRDTLIGLGRRLLRDPRQWRAVQRENHITDPRHIPLGTGIRIPYTWLRLSPESATIDSAAGSVRGDAGAVQRGQTLSEGSSLETGADGSVTLDLADGSSVTLEKSSSLRLGEMRGVDGAKGAHDIRLELKSGRMQSTVRPNGGSGRFEIVTPVAVSAVRGTSFRSAFRSDTQQAGAETLGGTVAVSDAASAVDVGAGFGTRVLEGAPPMKPVPLLPPPDLSAVTNPNTAARLHIEWPAVAGAHGYRLQLAPDADFHSIVIDSESVTPQVDVPAPPDGAYWMRVRAIDGFGLEGVDARRMFAQHELPAAPELRSPGPVTRISGARAEFAWTAVAGAAGYRLQIAADRDFSQPLIERSTPEPHAEIDTAPQGRFFWRVAAANAQGELGAWSATQSYAQTPSAPTPERAALSASELRLQWQAQPDMRYHLQVSRDPEFRQLLVDETLDQSTFALPRPRPGHYYTRLQTIDRDGAGPFGPTGHFTVPWPFWTKVLLPAVALIALIH